MPDVEVTGVGSWVKDKGVEPQLCGALYPLGVAMATIASRSARLASSTLMAPRPWLRAFPLEAVEVTSNYQPRRRLVHGWDPNFARHCVMRSGCRIGVIAISVGVIIRADRTSTLIRSVSIGGCYSGAGVIVTGVGIISSNNNVFADGTSSLSGTVSIGGRCGSSGATLTDGGILGLTWSCGWEPDVLANR